MISTGQWYIDIPAAVAAALVAYGIVWRKGVLPGCRGLRRAWRGIKHAVEIGAQLSDIAAELKPNSGKSLRDGLDRTEALAVQTKGAVDEVRGQLAEHMLAAGQRDQAIEDLRANSHELLVDFQGHKNEDAVSFGELKGGVRALQGAVETFVEVVSRAAHQSELRSEPPQ